MKRLYHALLAHLHLHAEQPACVAGETWGLKRKCPDVASRNLGGRDGCCWRMGTILLWGLGRGPRCPGDTPKACFRE